MALGGVLRRFFHPRESVPLWGWGWPNLILPAYGTSLRATRTPGPPFSLPPRSLLQAEGTIVFRESPGGFASPSQVPPVHVGDDCFETGAALSASRKAHRAHVAAVAKRKLGLCSGGPAPPPRRKRRRTKAYALLAQVDQMLKTSSDRRLSDFAVQLDGDGRLMGDVWKLPGLSLSTDSGPDCAWALALPQIAPAAQNRSPQISQCQTPSFSIGTRGRTSASPQLTSPAVSIRWKTIRALVRLVV